mmetsp:Transcript_22334/g.54591  ORF Transcript_22334/g.54591 Transcript_22334/m.54591 type:complete len:216 (+) Transcript_22334:969-1616(+)
MDMLSREYGVKRELLELERDARTIEAERQRDHELEKVRRDIEKELQLQQAELIAQESLVASQHRWQLFWILFTFGTQLVGIIVSCILTLIGYCAVVWGGGEDWWITKLLFGSLSCIVELALGKWIVRFLEVLAVVSIGFIAPPFFPLVVGAFFEADQMVVQQVTTGMRLAFPIIGGAAAALIKMVLLRNDEGALDRALAVTTRHMYRLLAIAGIQ